jgi:hypothetical protein
MTSENKHVALSPTVLQVIERFVTVMRGDEGIPGDAIDRLEELLRGGDIPKPEEVYAALFEPPRIPEP